MTAFEGLVARLARHAREVPERRAVVFCRGDGDSYTETGITFRELHRQACATASWLYRHTAPGDRVMLLYPQGIEFVVAFLGCLYAGRVPVATPLPAANRGHAERTDRVVRDAGIRLVLTEPAQVDEVTAWLGAPELTVRALESGDPGEWTDPGVGPGTLAFLQYTSGSTSAPRGVMVSHGNIEHNIRTMTAIHGWHERITFCSWLPTYHDMGLIAMLLGPLYLGGTVVLLSPTDFLKRPFLWLTLVADYRAQVSCAPNFAYELCARRITDAQLARLDLSGWVSACNGAEPIDPATLTRFAERFAPAGFRFDAFAPGYGLAEATLCVSGTHPDEPIALREVDPAALERDEVRPPRPGGARRTLCASGRVGDHTVRIVDPVTREVLPAGRVGEIWVASGSVAQGYWRRPQETEATFRARTADGGGPFLRTGDLGILEDSGLIYVVGRLKEVLVVHGRNLHPHDIERTVTDLDEAFTGRTCCAFSVQVPQEEIVVVQEVRPTRLDGPAAAALTDLIRREVSGALGVRVANVALVRVGRIPKTTSGKIRRTLTRELFRSGDLEALHEDLDPATRARFRTPVSAGAA